MQLLGEFETCSQGLELSFADGGVPHAQVPAQEAFVKGDHHGASVHAGELLLRAVGLVKQGNQLLERLQGILVAFADNQGFSIGKTNTAGRVGRLDVKEDELVACGKKETGLALLVFYLIKGKLIVAAFDCGQLHAAAGRNVFLGIGKRDRKKGHGPC